MAGGGWWRFDVWDSEEDARRIFDGMLTPAAHAAEIAPPAPQLRDVAWDNRRKMRTS